MLLYYLIHFFNLKLNFKLKIDPKVCNFKNLVEILKTWKNLPKTIGNPASCRQRSKPKSNHY